MSTRRPIQPSDTTAKLEVAMDERCCRTCHHGRHRGCTSGPHCRLHYATDMEFDPLRFVCPDHEMRDMTHPIWTHTIRKYNYPPDHPLRIAVEKQLAAKESSEALSRAVRINSRNQ